MDILIKPLVTEKVLPQGKKFNRYGFIVNPKANKIQIKEAVEELYNVEVLSVNTLSYNGKRKMRYTKAGMVSGKTKQFKKALVTLVKGDTINFYSNI